DVRAGTDVDAARGFIHQQHARLRPLDGTAEQELLLIAATELAGSGAEPALIDGDALGEPRADPSQPQPVQDAKARMCTKAAGQEVFEHAALMEYALGSAILGQKQDIALHATRRRAEVQGLAVDAHAAARTGDEARERAGHHIGARADLPGD